MLSVYPATFCRCKILYDDHCKPENSEDWTRFRVRVYRAEPHAPHAHTSLDAAGVCWSVLECAGVCWSRRQRRPRVKGAPFLNFPAAADHRPLAIDYISLITYRGGWSMRVTRIARRCSEQEPRPRLSLNKFAYRIVITSSTSMRMVDDASSRPRGRAACEIIDDDYLPRAL